MSEPMSSERFDKLIDDMTRDLAPVRPWRAMHGMAVVSLVGLLAIAVYLLWYGLRSDFLALRPNDTALVTLLISAGLCVVSSWHAVRMSTPGVGHESGGWRWAVLIALAIPLAGALTYLAPLGDGAAVASAAATTSETAGHTAYPIDCVLQSLIVGLAVGGALTWWLRRGAPTSARRAGLLVGIAAGSAGVTAVALHCPQDSLSHIGLWHSLAVVISAGAGAVLLPRLISW